MGKAKAPDYSGAFLYCLAQAACPLEVSGVGKALELFLLSPNKHLCPIVSVSSALCVTYSDFCEVRR